jgi:hypothetical protein
MVLEMTVGIVEDDDVVLEGVVSPASLGPNSGGNIEGLEVVLSETVDEILGALLNEVTVETAEDDMELVDSVVVNVVTSN